MATPRKSKARAGRRPSAKAGAARPARRTAAKRAAKPAPKPAKARKAPAKPVTLKAAGKPAAGARSAAKPSSKPARAAAPPAPVRPMGVLPATARARANERRVPPPPARPRTQPARPAAPGGPPPAAQRVSGQDLERLRDRLHEEYAKIQKEMGHIEENVLKVNQRDSSGDLSGYSFHMADAGTDAMEREKAFLFASTEGRTLLEIKEALGRMYRGDYGVCESCGLPIALGRLEAMPYARLCVSCKQKEEQASRGQGQG
jgi:RNA polymerase-binding transcription factor DksA